MSRHGGVLRKPLAGVAVVGAAVRLAWLLRSRPLSELPERLRAVRPLPRPLRDPRLLAAGVDRLLPWLPPWGAGRCLKRSLLLLDLWSRCGIQPRLHLGVRRLAAGGWEGHAWLSEGPLPAALGEGSYREVVVFGG